MALQSELLSFIKDGVAAREVYQHALSYVKNKKPELEKHFVKNIGFGVNLCADRVKYKLNIAVYRLGLNSATRLIFCRQGMGEY